MTKLWGQKFEASEYLTLEKFATEVAYFILHDLQANCSTVTVSAYKSAIFAAAEGPGVELTRAMSDFEKQ